MQPFLCANTESNWRAFQDFPFHHLCQKNCGCCNVALPGLLIFYLSQVQFNTSEKWKKWFKFGFPVYLQILETPSLLAEGSSGVKKNIFKQKPPLSDASSSGCCSWWLSCSRGALTFHFLVWSGFQVRQFHYMYQLSKIILLQPIYLD